MLESSPVNSSFADHQALSTVLDGLSNQILRLRQHVEVIRSQPADDVKAGKHQTFGGDDLSPAQKERIAKVVEMEKQRKTVPLDHSLVLIKHLVQVKTENLELESYVKEMQAKL